LGCSISCEVKSLTVIIQGADDQYGTIRQVSLAQEECYCPVEVTLLAGAGRSPHREETGATQIAISEFANAVLRGPPLRALIVATAWRRLPLITRCIPPCAWQSSGGAVVVWMIAHVLQAGADQREGAGGTRGLSGPGPPITVGPSAPGMGVPGGSCVDIAPAGASVGLGAPLGAGCP
jgi:hypothetical protein